MLVSRRPVALGAALLFACGDDAASSGQGGAGGAPTTSPTATVATSTASSSAGGAGGQAPLFVGRCGDQVPEGATDADAPKPYSGGACPALVAGPNTLPSGGADRAFLLVLPADYDPAQTYPTAFLWHWLGGSADDFLTRAEVQEATDTQGFIAVIPEKKGDLTFTWPVESFQSQPRVDEELTFFDDMLSCVAEQYTVDTSCVSSVGVSAGALWTDRLASARSRHLASFVSLSGGTGGVIEAWAPAEHKLPGLVLWGGSTDSCQGLLSFETLSQDLMTHLEMDGHFFLECIHNCGHSEPPFEAPPGFSKYKGMWDFVRDHPFWLSPGASPYVREGLSPDLPEWCAIGMGSATERTGPCLDPSQC